MCFVTTVSRHGSQRSRIITISFKASVWFCLFTFRFLLLKRALEPADLTRSALSRTTPPWESHRGSGVAPGVHWANSYLPESPMRTINWDILRWSSRTPRGCSPRGRHGRHGPRQTRDENGKQAISFQGTPPSAETFARTGSLGTSLEGSSPSFVAIQSPQRTKRLSSFKPRGLTDDTTMEVNSEFPTLRLR